MAASVRVITLCINPLFSPEKVYVWRTLLTDFLGVEFSLSYHLEDAYHLLLENGKTLIFPDVFFSKNTNGYLVPKAIPTEVSFAQLPFIPEEDIPILYGNDKMEWREEGLYCGIDLVASVFFMLTRWEEAVLPTRDDLNRFPATASLAYQKGFLDRPIVNEYTEMLWAMLVHLGITHPRKDQSYQVMVTHDVDVPFVGFGFRSRFRKCVGDIIKRRRLRQAIQRIFSPNYFDFLMLQSERYGLKSHFYFMSGGHHEYDYYFDIQDPSLKTLIRQIQKRGHIIGFHPSFDSFNQPSLWNAELTALQNVVSGPIREGRQHFLRFSIPDTWQLWEDSGMSIDSSLGYADCEGFRCGTCVAFHPFNVVTQKTLRLLEYPLVLMEHTLINYRQQGPNEVRKTFHKYKNKIKKYKGIFVFLWHNHLLEGWEPTYREVISDLAP